MENQVEQSATNAQDSGADAQEVVITSESVLAMLRAGKSRKEIQKELNLSNVEAKELWSLPGLKNKKVYKTQVRRTNIKFVDNIPAVVAKEAEHVAEASASNDTQAATGETDTPVVQQSTGAFGSTRQG